MQEAIRLWIAYDGTPFFGWQKTKAGPSIQESLEKALRTILQQPVEVEAASRTDRGVHAKGQVVQFIAPFSQDLPKLKQSLNALLPQEIAVVSIQKVGLHTHPTLDAKQKTYSYSICNSPNQLPQERLYSWHVPHDLDLELMQKAAAYLVGTHDFTSFSNDPRENRVCCLYEIEVSLLSNKKVFLSLKGDRFLYKMARNIVGTLVYIGLKKMNGNALPQILASKTRALAGPAAPAKGLFLTRVDYAEK